MQCTFLNIKRSRFLTFLAVLVLFSLYAFPSLTHALTPIGKFESIDTNGIAKGWVVDPDSLATSIDVHFYLDAPAGTSGSRYIGKAHATVLRNDLVKTYRGNHGFLFPLPPIVRDGKPHKIYAYGIDTSGIGAQNLVISGSPRSTTLQSSISYLDNGVLKVGVEMGCGGVISVLKHNGTDLVNNFDCTGRQLQIAAYDGNATYDACGGCTGQWGWDPVQGGDRHNFGSPVLSKTVGTSTIYVKTQPYEWYPEKFGGGPGSPVLSDLIIEEWISLLPDNKNAIKVHYKVTYTGSEIRANAIQEFPSVHVNYGFDRAVSYTGSAPWTNDAVTILPNVGSGGSILLARENWESFVNTSDTGLTIFNPTQYPHYKGVYNPNVALTGPFGDAENYLRPDTPFSFYPGSVMEGNVYYIAGDYRAAREYIYQLQPTLSPTDTVPPYGWVDLPQSGTVTGTTTVSGWFFDNAEEVETVSILLDDTEIGTATYGLPRADIPRVFPGVTANSGFSYSLNTQAFTNGPHALSVEVVDNAGNKTRWKNIDLTFSNTTTTKPPPPPPPPLPAEVDTIVPSISITNPTNSASVSGTVTLSANATDNSKIESVYFLMDGAGVGSTFSEEPFSVEWNSTTASDGTHTFVAVAKDTAGNKSSASTSFTVNNAPVTTPTLSRGSQVNVTSSKVPVYFLPGTKFLRGYQTSQILGSVTDGPQTVSTVRYWKVDFSRGVDGWVDESKLVLALSTLPTLPNWAVPETTDLNSKPGRNLNTLTPASTIARAEPVEQVEVSNRRSTFDSLKTFLASVYEAVVRVF